MSDNTEDDLDIFRRISEKSREYADFWDWPLDRSLGELDVAQTLHNYLIVFEPDYEGKISHEKNDPPDTALKTRQGRTIGIEVSEIVNSQMVERHRYLKENQRNSIIQLASWSADALAQHIAKALKVKDSKLQAARQRFDEIIVCLFTDEYLIDPPIAQNAVHLCNFNGINIDRAFLLLSYTPDVDEKKVFPYGYPVFEIKAHSSSTNLLVNR